MLYSLGGLSQKLYDALPIVVYRIPATKLIR